MDKMQDAQPKLSRNGGRWALLSAVAIGHGILHWYQQGFLVIFPTIKADMSLSATQAGLIISVRQVLSGLVNIPAGVLTDRLRTSWPLIFAFSVLSVGVGYLLVGLSPVYLVLLLTVGLAGTHPLWHLPGVAALSESLPEKRGFAISIHGMGATVGDTLGPYMLGLLLVLLTWRQAMVFSSLPAFFLCIVVFLVMRGLIRTSPSRGLQESGISAEQEPVMEKFRTLLGNKRLMALVGAAGFRSASQQTIIPFLAIYLKEDLAMSDPIIGIHISLLTLLGVVSSPVLGSVSDRVGRKPVLVTGMVILASLVLILAAIGSGWKLTLMVTLMGIFIYSLSSIILAMSQDMVGEGVRATATGFIFTGNQGLAMPAPFIAGFLVDTLGDTRVAFVMSSFMYLAAAVIIALIPLSPSDKQRDLPSA
jgi:FSR family fosmidomycin resistance protein-like MFS transporter